MNSISFLFGKGFISPSFMNDTLASILCWKLFSPIFWIYHSTFSQPTWFLLRNQLIMWYGLTYMWQVSPLAASEFSLCLWILKIQAMFPIWMVPLAQSTFIKCWRQGFLPWTCPQVSLCDQVEPLVVLWSWLGQQTGLSCTVCHWPGSLVWCDWCYSWHEELEAMLY